MTFDRMTIGILTYGSLTIFVLTFGELTNDQVTIGVGLMFHFELSQIKLTH